MSKNGNMSKNGTETKQGAVTAPHSPEVEEALLAAVMLEPETFAVVASMLDARDFFIVRHGWVWEAMAALFARGDAIDPITVCDELGARGRLEEVGGMAWLMSLLLRAPNTGYVETYARLIRRASLRRKLLVAAGEIARLAGDGERDIEAVLSEAQALLAGVSSLSTRRDVLPLAEIASVTFDEVEKARAAQYSGLPTGFSDLDRLMGGLQKSDLVVVAGRPGMGKSSWLLTVARNVARAGGRVLLASLEMSQTQNAQRLIALETGVSTERQRTGRMSEAEFARFTEGVGRIGSLPIWIDDTPSLTPEQLRARALRIQAQHGLQLVLVDYLQLMTLGRRAENKVQEVSEISRALKGLARELNVPVVTAAQLSRAVEQRNDKRPQLSDLRDSGAIEQDADVVLFLYRADYYDKNAARSGEVELIVAKHRNGPTGTVPLFFDGVLTRFADLTRKQADMA